MALVPVSALLLTLIIQTCYANDHFNTTDVSVNKPNNGSFSSCIQTGRGNYFNCAVMKAVKVLQKMSKEKSIPVISGVTLENENPSPGNLFDLHVDAKSEPIAVVRSLFKATTRFMDGRALKIKLPRAAPENIARALEEGRGKVKKLLTPVMLGMGAKMMVGVFGVALVALGLLASKSLAVSTIALIISLLLSSTSTGLPFQFPGKNNIGWPFGNWGGGYGGYGGYPGLFGTPYGNGGSWATNAIGGWGTSPGQYPYARSIEEEREK